MQCSDEDIDKLTLKAIEALDLESRRERNIRFEHSELKWQ